MMKRFIAALYLLSGFAFGEITAPYESQYLNYPNLVVNPGFENGKTKWVFGAGPTVVITSTAANVGKGLYALSWDSTATSQTFHSNLATIPSGSYGKNCVARIKYKGGTNTTFEVNDGTSTITSTNLINTTDYTQATLLFLCPTSGAIELKFTSTTNGAIFYLDDTYLGENYLVGDDTFNPDVLPWKVDATVSGTNPNLGSADVASYTSIASSALTLTNNAGVGNLTAQIPCSSTNPPTGTTCAVGDENVGVSFVLPVAGDVLACVSFSHSIAITSANAGASVDTTFQIVNTPINAQTITAEGNTRIENKARQTSNVSNLEEIRALRVCGNFSFATAGQKVLRLMYEQDNTGTISANDFLTDQSAANGQRDAHWEVYPTNQQIPAPVLVGTLATASTGLMRIIRGTVTPGAGACTLNFGEGFTVTDGGAGECNVNFDLAYQFTGTPSCVCTLGGSASGQCGFDATSTTTAQVETRNSSFTLTDGLTGDFICIGPR